jgi:hypothetical protein
MKSKIKLSTRTEANCFTHVTGLMDDIVSRNEKLESKDEEIKQLKNYIRDLTSWTDKLPPCVDR